MNENKGLLALGAGAVRRNKRYIVWFFLLNLLLAAFGTAGFSTHAHAIMDHSMYSDGLLHGFHPVVLIELLNRPEFGPTESSTMPAVMCAVVFVGLTLVFMPGVLLGYSSDHRISRDEFFRACGRNLWGFVRLFILSAILSGIVYRAFIAASDPLLDALDKTNYERLPFFTHVAVVILMFGALNVVRMWFDVAQADVVLADQRAVRKSLGVAFRSVKRGFSQLFVAYMTIAFVGLLIIVVGLLLWYFIVPSSSLVGAFLISQLTLLLLLATRFWQRAAAVAFYARHAAQPVVEMPQAAVPAPVVAG